MIFKRRLLLVGIALPMLVVPGAARAQCVAFENPEDLFARADVVFTGTVLTTETTGARGAHAIVEIAAMRVEQLWKGRLAPEVRVGADRPFEPKKRYVVFAAGNPLSTSILCRWTELVDRAQTKLDWLAKRRKEQVLQSDGAASLYAPLLQERYHAVPATRMSVKDRTLPMPTLTGSSDQWLKLFDDVPLELRRAAGRPSPTKADAFDVSLLPDGTHVVSAAAVDALPMKGVAEYWAAFKRKFGSDGWLAFSDSILSKDELHALIYYEARCGGLCGEGGYVWLRRDTVDSPWWIAKKIVRWLS